MFVCQCEVICAVYIGRNSCVFTLFLNNIDTTVINSRGNAAFVSLSSYYNMEYTVIPLEPLLELLLKSTLRVEHDRRRIAQSRSLYHSGRGPGKQVITLEQVTHLDGNLCKSSSYSIFTVLCSFKICTSYASSLLFQGCKHTHSYT